MSAQAANASAIAAVLEFVWDKFGERILEGGVKWGWKGTHWKLAADRYGDKLKEDYGKLFVLGQPNPKPIDDIYTYVNVLDKVSAFKRHGTEELESMFVARGLMHKEEERADGLKKVQEGHNLFIVGKPGAGKTTFLKQVTMKAAAGKLTRVVDDYVRSFLPENMQAEKELTQLPIFISLRTHADSDRQTIFESIEHELKICGFPDAAPFISYLLHSGRALVLLDGLDEVRQDDDQRRRLSDEIADFMRQYLETQFLITCRVAAADYSFENVQFLEMADFDDAQKRVFIYRWFDDRQMSDQCWQELLKEENKGLRELARVPLLLTLLAITYDETNHFPQRRVEIYEEAVGALLNKWDARRRINRGEEVYKQLSLGRKRQLMAHIAAQTFDEGHFLFSKRKLAGMIETFMARVPGVEEEQVDGEEILVSIAARHGFFVEQARDIYSFAHLSFHEYFTAKYIVANARQGTLERLLYHAADDQWREVFLQAVSLLDDDADEFFELFLQHLNGLRADDNYIQLILTWAQIKAETARRAMQPAYKPAALRAWYFYRAFASVSDPVLHRPLDRDLHRPLDRDLDRALDLALDLASTLGSVLDRALASAFDLDLDLDLALDFASTRTLDRASTPTHIRALDLKKISEQLLEFGYNKLSEQVSLINVPGDGADRKAWQPFSDTVNEVQNEFGRQSGIAYLSGWSDEGWAFVQGIDWTANSLNAVNEYLKATRLLVDCLPLAMVSDRAGIEEQLLLPAPESLKSDLRS